MTLVRFDRLATGIVCFVATLFIGGAFWFALTEPMTPDERCGAQYDSPP
jgi:hypothetical protein